MEEHREEQNLWKNFNCCGCLKNILCECGYDNVHSLELLNSDSLDELETHMIQDQIAPKIIQRMSCNHYKIYRAQQNFKILPGHRIVLLKWCESLKHRQTESRTEPKIKSDDSAFSPILREIILAASTNFNKPPNARRYSELLMNFATYIYIMAGKATYEIISANLPIPKAKTILNHIHEDKGRIIEGELRCAELVTYLKQSNYPKSVVLSEDGSGVVKKVVFDSRNNQLIGLVLPFHNNTGMPKLFSFKVNSAKDIEQYMKLPQSKLVYIVVAQPLSEHARPFILQIFGTDNRFKFCDVLKRWDYTKTELKRYGIDVIAVSSDGDSRLLSAMKSRTTLDLIPHIDVLKRIQERMFYPDSSPLDFTCVQDSIHIGTKLRNRLLNSSIVLRIGDEVVSALHLKMLIDSVSKETHGLVHSDIYPEDRQNFRSLLKVMEQRVLELLQKNVADSKGTVMYLTLCKQITSSYLQPNLEPIDRIYMLWNAVYFLRCWRKWIQISKNGYTMANNFITSNAYTCVELNAQALIELIVKLRCRQSQSMFITEFFSSQPCEQFFRQMRSMGTMNFTKINFTLYELLHMNLRVELMNKIIFTCKEIVSPRIEQNEQNTETLASSLTVILPSNEQIIQTMMNARYDALQKANEFGIILTWEDIVTCDIQHLNNSEDEILSVGVMEIMDDLVDEEENEISDHSMEAEELNNNHIELVDSDGSTRKIRKSTFIWMLSKSNDKLSSDRLIRVQGSDTPPNKRFKSGLESGTLSSGTISDTKDLFKSTHLKIGEWAIFNRGQDKNNDAIHGNSSGNSLISSHLIGIVVGFRYVEEKTNEKTNQKRKQITKYKSSIAPTEKHIENTTGNKIIQVLSIWYDCNENGTLNPSQSKDNFEINIDSYVATMKTPIAKRKNNSPPNSSPDNSIVYILPFEYSEFGKFITDLFSKNR